MRARAVGLVQAACFDGTDLRARSSRDLDDNKRGLADPDARLGRDGKGFYLGYRTVFLTDVEGFPLGHVEAPANVNEPLMVEPLLDRVLGEDLEVELLAGDSGFESRRVFEALDARKVESLVAWRRMRGRENPPDVLTVRDRIDVEGPEWKRAVYKRLRAVVEGFIGRVKSRLAYGRLTWQGLENASIHVSLVLMVVYALAIAAFRLERPELRHSVAFFACGRVGIGRVGLADAVCLEVSGGSGGRLPSLVCCLRRVVVSWFTARASSSRRGTSPAAPSGMAFSTEKATCFVFLSWEDSASCPISFFFSYGNGGGG